MKACYHHRKHLGSTQDGHQLGAHVGMIHPSLMIELVRHHHREPEGTH